MKAEIRQMPINEQKPYPQPQLFRHPDFEAEIPIFAFFCQILSQIQLLV